MFTKKTVASTGPTPLKVSPEDKIMVLSMMVDIIDGKNPGMIYLVKKESIESTDADSILLLQNLRKSEAFSCSDTLKEKIGEGAVQSQTPMTPDEENLVTKLKELKTILEAMK